MKRIITTVVVIPILVVVLWLAPPSVFVGLTAIAVVLGIREFQLMAEKLGCEPQKWIGWLGGVFILVGFWRNHLSTSVLVLAAVTAVSLISHLIRRRRLDAALVSTSVTLAGVVYVGLFMGYVVGLRLARGEIASLSAKLLSFFFLVIWAGDSLAMLTGRAIGQHRLLPVVSPKKTVEGSIGGLIGSLAAALLAAVWFFPELRLGHALLLGLVMGIVGQVGDWCESMLKRGSQIKDAAALIPGHGGILDRLDSLLFNAPILYYYYLFFLTS